jgi:cardiolipin synthase
LIPAFSRFIVSSMNAKTLLQPANLLSLSRVALTPLIGYFLARGDDRVTVICVALMTVAAITDGLDGMVARRLNQVSKVGIALDPIADKIFAGVLVVLLILYRGFPIWLAVVIIARDLLILLAGLLLLRGRRLVVPANLMGKYTFASIAVLLLSYVMRYEFGMLLMTWVTLAFLAVSMVTYARVFAQVQRGEAPAPGSESPVFRAVRLTLVVLFAIVYLYGLYLSLR